MRLSDLQTGQTGIVVKILGHGAFRKRVMEMGFVKGRRVHVLLDAPLKDPIKYSIMDYEVSLRRSEANLIEVVPAPVADADITLPERETLEGSDLKNYNLAENEHQYPTTWPSNVINVALVGNPNCGKTSLFNHLSGARQHVGNYSGVTVDAVEGHLRYLGYTINLVDLPGTYSLASYSPEERYVRKYLAERTPDVIINVVDASNLERNLYLTTELIDMGRSMVIALNMYDELEGTGTEFDYKTLGKMIGVPIVPTTAKNGQGLHKLLDKVVQVYEGKAPEVRHVHVKLGQEMEYAVGRIKDEIKRYGETGHHFSPRYMAIKLVEGDKETMRRIEDTPHGAEIIKLRNELVHKVEASLDEDVNSIIAGEKYGFIAGALAETMTGPTKKANNSTEVIDAFVTNKLFGFPMFFAAMFFIFWLTFSLGQYPMDWLQDSVDFLSNSCHRYLPEGPLKDLLADGIIGGVGGVIVFLPNILILYFCISFMEDSGYMARAAFIMDKVMHKIGLHGKSFIPLIMGFGCNVPAIIASRSIESRSSRIITILINPFMSCSARLPLYVLLIGTFIPQHGAVVFMGLYVLGILISLITAKLLRKFVFQKDETPFVMELPPYRLPSLRTSLRHTWDKGAEYLRKMGGVILLASIVVWALNYFPHHDNENNKVPTSEPGYTQAHDIASNSANLKGQKTDEIDANVPNSPKTEATQSETGSSAIDIHNDSFLEMAGKAINPLMEPLGFTWRGTVAAMAGVPAKEIVVSTLGVLYTGDKSASDQTLGNRIESTINPKTGEPAWTLASALAFMVFILLYCPCMATILAIVRETGSWRYGAFSILYNTGVAWVMAFIVYRIVLLI